MNRLNLARHLSGIETGLCTTLLGVAAVAGAAGMYLGIGLLVFPILMVLAGGRIGVRQLTRASSAPGH